MGTWGWGVLSTMHNAWTMYVGFWALSFVRGAEVREGDTKAVQLENAPYEICLAHWRARFCMLRAVGGACYSSFVRASQDFDCVVG